MFDIDNVNSERMVTLVNHLLESKSESVKEKAVDLSKEEIKNLIEKQMPGKGLEKLAENIKKIIDASDYFSRVVELRVNKEINRIIITILDKNTNQVIREIPCVEIQDLDAHLKEAIGVLFDTKA
jgi:flagellar protein FlaG